MKVRMLTGTLAAAAAALALTGTAAQAATHPAGHTAKAASAAASSAVRPATEWYFPDSTTYNYICSNTNLWFSGTQIWGHDVSHDVMEYVVDWTEDGPSTTFLEMSFYRGDGTDGSFGMRC